MREKGESRVARKPRRGGVGQGEGSTAGPGGAAAVVSGTRPQGWALKNSRRISLITKQFSQGLDPDEEIELGALQAEADRYLDEVAPLPFEHLEQLEERAHLPPSGHIGTDGDRANSS